MRDYGTKTQLIRLYNSFVVGYFSHGLDCQPLFSEKWYSRLQKIVCNFLKVMRNKTYAIIRQPIAQNDLL